MFLSVLGQMSSHWGCHQVPSSPESSIPSVPSATESSIPKSSGSTPAPESSGSLVQSCLGRVPGLPPELVLHLGCVPGHPHKPPLLLGYSPFDLSALIFPRFSPVGFWFFAFFFSCTLSILSVPKTCVDCGLCLFYFIPLSVPPTHTRVGLACWSS